MILIQRFAVNDKKNFLYPPAGKEYSLFGNTNLFEEWINTPSHDTHTDPEVLFKSVMSRLNFLQRSNHKGDSLFNDSITIPTHIRRNAFKVRAMIYEITKN